MKNLDGCSTFVMLHISSLVVTLATLNSEPGHALMYDDACPDALHAAAISNLALPISILPITVFDRHRSHIRISLTRR
jgi:hypothetical protein